MGGNYGVHTRRSCLKSGCIYDVYLCAISYGVIVNVIILWMFRMSLSIRGIVECRFFLWFMYVCLMCLNHHCAISIENVHVCDILLQGERLDDFKHLKYFNKPIKKVHHRRTVTWIYTLLHLNTNKIVYMCCWFVQKVKMVI